MARAQLPGRPSCGGWENQNANGPSFRRRAPAAPGPSAAAASRGAGALGHAPMKDGIAHEGRAHEAPMTDGIAAAIEEQRRVVREPHPPAPKAARARVARPAHTHELPPFFSIPLSRPGPAGARVAGASDRSVRAVLSRRRCRRRRRRAWGGMHATISGPFTAVSLPPPNPCLPSLAWSESISRPCMSRPANAGRWAGLPRRHGGPGRSESPGCRGVTARGVADRAV